VKIISHKNIKYDYDAFFTATINNPIIDGVAFDILMTKDKKVLIYTPSENHISTIDTIQKSTYMNLKNSDIISLEEVLTKFTNSNKKIILNLLPIISNTLTSDNYIDVNKLNQEYVITVKKIIDKFPTLEFYLCSAYDNLVQQIRLINPTKKIGYIINNLSTSYIDVDFYVFTVNVLDEKIINQQLSFNKEVMIYILNCDDITTVMKGISKRIMSGTINKIALNEIYFINNYPELFWKLIN